MDSSFLEQLANEELLFQKFSLVGTGNVLASGSLKAGYAVNVGASGDEAGADGGGGGPPPPRGACCYGDETSFCTVATPAYCGLIHGHYQGNGTNCADVDCTQGACCVAGVCSIETPAGCDDLGGTFQGYGSPCDPNPCMPPCACSSPYEHGGLFYLTKTSVYTLTYDAGGPGTTHVDILTTNICHLTPDEEGVCIETCEDCSGSLHCNEDDPPTDPCELDGIFEGSPCVFSFTSCDCSDDPCGSTCRATVSQLMTTGCVGIASGCEESFVVTYSDECIPGG